MTAFFSSSLTTFSTRVLYFRASLSHCYSTTNFFSLTHWWCLLPASSSRWVQKNFKGKFLNPCRHHLPFAANGKQFNIHIIQCHLKVLRKMGERLTFSFSFLWTQFFPLTHFFLTHHIRITHTHSLAHTWFPTLIFYFFISYIFRIYQKEENKNKKKEWKVVLRWWWWLFIFIEMSKTLQVSQWKSGCVWVSEGKKEKRKLKGEEEEEEMMRGRLLKASRKVEKVSVSNYWKIVYSFLISFLTSFQILNFPSTPVEDLESYLKKL